MAIQATKQPQGKEENKINMTSSLKIRRRDTLDTVVVAVMSYLEDTTDEGGAIIQTLDKGGVRHKFLARLFERYTDKSMTLPNKYATMIHRVYNAALEPQPENSYAQNLTRSLEKALAAAQTICDSVDIEPPGTMPALYNLLAVKSRLHGKEDVDFWMWAANKFDVGFNLGGESWSRDQDYKLTKWFLHGVRHRLCSVPAMTQVVSEWIHNTVQVNPSDCSCFHDMACMVLAAYPRCKVWDSVVQAFFQSDSWLYRLQNEVYHTRSWKRKCVHHSIPGIKWLAKRVYDDTDEDEDGDGDGDESDSCS